MFLSRYAGIHELGYDSSRDLEAKASTERPAATSRLYSKQGSVLRVFYADTVDGYNPHFALFISATIS
jgi:hypothetical protein